MPRGFSTTPMRKWRLIPPPPWIHLVLLLVLANRIHKWWVSVPNLGLQKPDCLCSFSGTNWHLHMNEAQASVKNVIENGQKECKDQRMGRSAVRYHIFWTGHNCCAHKLTKVVAAPEAPLLPEQLWLLEMVGREISFSGINIVKLFLVTSNTIKCNRATIKAWKEAVHMLVKRGRGSLAQFVNG